MSARLASIFLTSCLLACNLAQAECSYPKAPDSIPDPSSATEPQMVAAMQAFKQYNTDVDSYVTCLETETKDKVKDADAGTVMQIKAMQAKKKSAATDERQAKIDEFNKAVRAFKAKG